MGRWMFLLALCSIAGLSLAARPLNGEEHGQLKVSAKPPKWPSAYEMEYTLTLPYIQSLQPQGLRYPIHVWWDGPGKRYRFDVYGGMDSNGWDKDKGLLWYVYPRIKVTFCDFVNKTDGPTLSHDQLMGAMGLLGGEKWTPLPDISGWEYAGTAQVGNGRATVWQWSNRQGEKTAEYTFYTARDGAPLRLYMMGVNLLTGTHFDEFIMEFTRFKPGSVASSAFELPTPCDDKVRQQQQQQQQQQQRQQDPEEEPSDGPTGLAWQKSVAARLGMLLPSVRLGASLGPNEALSELRRQAASAFETNARRVEEHNRRSSSSLDLVNGQTSSTDGSKPTFTMGLNHFSHLTPEQWRATLLGRSAQSRSKREQQRARAGDEVGNTAAGGRRTYQRRLRDDQLPASVDWRGTGADGPVKDQACCGSCWALSAVSAMQGAWYKVTGEAVPFAAQQLMDCSWDYGNNGCFGGDVIPAIDYVVDAGGIAHEADYQYIGQNGFCRGPDVPPNHPSLSSAAAAATAAAAADGVLSVGAVARPHGPPAPLAGHFKGWLHVPPRDEGALMEVLALHGPVAIGISVPDSFVFYTEGVYYSDECGTTFDDLDHAVNVVGYGTTPEGVDYWIVKNTWSKYWGMDGYAKVARKGNDCGITTDPVLAVAVGDDLPV